MQFCAACTKWGATELRIDYSNGTALLLDRSPNTSKVAVKNKQNACHQVQHAVLDKVHIMGFCRAQTRDWKVNALLPIISLAAIRAKPSEVNRVLETGSSMQGCPISLNLRRCCTPCKALPITCMPESK